MAILARFLLCRLYHEYSILFRPIPRAGRCDVSLHQTYYTFSHLPRTDFHKLLSANDAEIACER